MNTANQFAFQATNIRTGRNEQIRATALNADDARDAIVNAYFPEYAISQAPVDVRPAHHILGEINCL